MECGVGSSVQWRLVRVECVCVECAVKASVCVECGWVGRVRSEG